MSIRPLMSFFYIMKSPERFVIENGNRHLTKKRCAENIRVRLEFKYANAAYNVRKRVSDGSKMIVRSDHDIGIWLRFLTKFFSHFRSYSLPLQLMVFIFLPARRLYM